MPLVDLLVSLVLFLIMLGIGTNLSINDFKRVLENSKALIIGLILQIILLPTTAFILLKLVSINDSYLVGIIILCLCPGGSTSNFVTYLFKLNTALSVSLTAINSILIFITIPIGVQILNQYYLSSELNISLPLISILLDMCRLIILPILIGLLLRIKFPKTSLKLKRPLTVIVVILFALVFIGKLFSNQSLGGVELKFQDIISIFPVILVIQLFSLIIAYIAGVVVLNSINDSLTITTEVGLQNTPLALVIVSGISSGDISKPIMIFATFSFLTTFLIVYFLKKIKKLK